LDVWAALSASSRATTIGSGFVVVALLRSWRVARVAVAEDNTASAVARADSHVGPTGNNRSIRTRYHVVSQPLCRVDMG